MRNTLSVILLAFAGVTGFAQQVPLNALPSRIVGHPLPEQTAINSGSPNLVEGRELAAPQGIALDTDVNPPYLYISDTGNSRILGWRNANSFRNGQPADLVIGQSSFYRTGAGGPSVSGSTFSTAMNGPTGITVYKGDVYVADNGNHRILRFRKPFNNIGNQLPDLHIGQPNFTTGRANYTGQVDRQGLSLGGNTAYLAFDANGNLWVTDAGNRRVLEFLAADVAAGPGPLSATLEIGQLNFTTVQTSVTTNTRTKADAFATPSMIAFDSAGRLYVTDAAVSGDTVLVSRVLVFTPPFSNGMAAARIMGVFSGNAPSQDAVDKTSTVGAEGLFFMPGISKMGLVDSGSSRILIYDTFDKWPDQGATFSPLATGVIGQPDFHNRGRNGSPGTYVGIANAQSLFGPTAVAFTGSELFVVDSGNHRVVVLPFNGGNFGPATRVLGQDSFNGQAVNLIEGREFYFAGNAETGIAIDGSGDTPHLYVADSGNHRVLGFNDVRKLQAGAKADLVIGQADFTTSVCNFQGLNSPDSGNVDRPTQSSLCNPTGLVVDRSGNLYVADTFNGRVLRFPAPFAHQGQLPQADLVIGQRSFTSKIVDPTPSTMAAPFGLSFVTDNGLLVSDTAHNRVLYFAFAGGGTFPAGDNGRAATKVFGQPDFFTVARTNTVSGMNSPRHVSSDNEARPYVSDTGNNRILIFDQINTVGNAGAPAAKILTGFSSPRGLYVNQATGEAWIGDNTTTVEKYPKFETLLINQASNGNVGSFLGLAITQDNVGNLAVADATHRVAFYYPGVQALNQANLLPTRQLSPGVIASICSPGSLCDPARTAREFGTATADHNSVPNPIPLPKSLADVQVLFNGEPTPLYFVSPTQINFIVPWSAPSSGTADIQVVQTSTGRIYGAGTVNMDTYSPAILGGYTGSLRQAAVLNQDNTINSPTNPAERGTYIQIFATGQGLVPNAPPDGTPPQTATPTPFGPRIFINSCFTEACPKDVGEAAPPLGFIGFSGLSPQFPGVWQINAYIPKSIGPGNQVPLAIVAGSKGNVDPGSGFQMTIAVK